MARHKRKVKKEADLTGLSRADKHFVVKSTLIIDAVNANNEKLLRLFGTTYAQYSMADIAKLIGLSRSSRLMRFLYVMVDHKMLCMITEDPKYGSGITDANLFFCTPAHYAHRPRTLDMFQEIA